MTTMYDSTNLDDIPDDAEIVAYYVDGGFAATDAQIARFPNAQKVRITVDPNNLNADVLDKEGGNPSTAEEAATWSVQSHGLQTVYHSESDEIDNVARHWVASWRNEGDETVPNAPTGGVVAIQYANPTTSGGHYDLSITNGTWPSVEPVPPAPTPDPTPQPQEEDMKPYYVTNSAGTGFVVSTDLSHKTGIPDGDDAKTLLDTGNYQQLKLSDEALAQIPG